MTTDPQSRYLSFGDFRLNCVSGGLQRSGREIKLQPQPAKLLVLLATRKGEVVTRAEIQNALWGEDTFVDFEHGINFCIRQIRDALGDSAEKPRYVETVPRVGYRFVAKAQALAPNGGEERSPYPGLSSFSSSDSKFFFGREGEVESVRRKLESRPMLALIGPSGSGKSSFLRAGLLPSLPDGVRVVLTTPGSTPVRALARALVTEVSGDTEAMRELMEDVVAAAARWRKRCERALVVVDAFEELFTLNPPEVQAEFAKLLGRLAKEAEVQVLLSMRDDFLIRCHDYEELSPVFMDLTPLGPLKGAALRRALVEPALSCGYRFETEELVEESPGSYRAISFGQFSR
jgi:DNA-binding winged helix-turn-helix (wHTH) protein